jgi:hypothetical protein
MSFLVKLVGLADTLESVWTFYTLLSGFRVGIFSAPWIPSAPWWLVPAIFLQFMLAIFLLGVAYGCLVKSQEVFLSGAIVSVGMLLTFVAMFGLVPNDYLAVAMVLCIVALLGNAFVWFREKSSR